MRKGQILDKYDRGDSLSNEELEAVADQVGKAATALMELGYDPYRLVVKDLLRKKESFEGYINARKQNR